MSETTSNLEPGDRVGDYELLASVGAGGMGRIWVARETGSMRRVAIKTALLEQGMGEKFISVLLDEARIASRIQHPNVCAIHGADQQEGMLYLVMDWSDGGSLREVLDACEGHRIGYNLAARIVARVCSGLHAAHELLDDEGHLLGVVHRDVSPQNILIATSGQVRITDFGIAKAKGQIHAPTQTGEVKGKLAYMAPEQVTSRDIDRRADVFALGCVLYEASTGERPFGGQDALSTMYQLLEQPIEPPINRDPNYPPGLNEIVVKALERDREKRYQTSEEVERALEMYLMTERAVVSDTEVGALVKRVLGERIAARELRIDQGTNRALVRASERPAPTPAPVEAQTLQTVVSSPPVARAPHPQAPGRIWAALGGVLLVAGGVVAALGAKGTHSEAAPVVESKPVNAAQVPSAPQVQTVASVAAPTVNTAQVSSSITIRLQAEPAQARWIVDGGPSLPNPQLLVVPKDGLEHEVRIVLEGYAEHRQRVRFESDQELNVVLKPAKRAATKSSTDPQPAVEAPPTAAPPPTFQDVPTGPRPPKPVRPLDPDNPFAKP